MRNNLLCFIASFLILSCQSIPKADRVIIAGQQPVINTNKSLSYIVDTSNSKVIWTGTKPIGQHTGTFKLTTGDVNFENGSINGGKFIIDIHSLTDTDLQGNAKKRLEEHLKSADFFEVEKHPAAIFEITKATLSDVTAKSVMPKNTHTISGNLTLKGMTKNVTFPAAINIADNVLEVKANFNIDRTEWGLNYGSEKSLQDRFIHHQVNIELDIKASRNL